MKNDKMIYWNVKIYKKSYCIAWSLKNYRSKNPSVTNSNKAKLKLLLKCAVCNNKKQLSNQKSSLLDNIFFRDMKWIKQ